MTTISLGISPCPNDVFIFSGLLLGQIPTVGLRFETDFQDVETLNQRAQQGALDLVKISYANYPLCADVYDLLGSGGALGRGCGPLLLTHGRNSWDPVRETLVPGEFTTANFLLDFYAKAPLVKRFLPFDALYEHLCRTPGAQGVVIHEKRFTYAQDGLTAIQDLGQYWEEQTGYAIPLGAIIARRELDMSAAFERIIRQSLTWAKANSEAAFRLCRECARDLNDEVIRSHIGLYVNEFSQDLGEEGRACVAYFLEQQNLRG